MNSDFLDMLSALCAEDVEASVRGRARRDRAGYGAFGA